MLIPRSALAASLLSVLALLAVACGSSDPSPTPGEGATGAPPAAASAGAAARGGEAPLVPHDAGPLPVADAAPPCATCPQPTTAWTCTRSAYHDKQYWTCSGGDLFECDASGPVVMRCKYGCVEGPPGTDDTCNTAPPPPGPPGYLLPLTCNQSAPITQGNNSPYSHNGYAAYGFDFGVPLNTPLHALDDGKVLLVKGDVGPGSPCYSGGGSGCANIVNYVVLGHADGTATLYMHLNAATVSVGQTVRRGEQVGLSGGTGWSTGPHAHVQRQEICGSWWCQSVPLSFGDVAGGVPVTGQVVTSRNGC